MSASEGDDAEARALCISSVHECVESLLVEVEALARQSDAEQGAICGSQGAAAVGSSATEETEEANSKQEEEDVVEEEEVGEEAARKVFDPRDLASTQLSADAKETVGEADQSVEAAAASVATSRSSKRAAAAAAFRHIKLRGVMVHAHPSLDDEDVNALLKHVAATKYGAAKDLFILVCDIEGAILIVSPRVLPTQLKEGRELVCDHVARVHDVDARILTPVLIHCLTASARQALMEAVSGVDAYLGEWCLLCSRPFVAHPDANIAFLRIFYQIKT